MDIKNTIVIIENFLSPEDCYNVEKHSPQLDRPENGNYAHAQSINVKKPEIVEINKKIENKTKKLFPLLSFSPGDPICVFFRKGNQMKIHVDDMMGDFNEIINCVVYATNPLFYKGGEIEFPTLGVTVKPNQGSAIFFDPKLPHGVKEIIDGERFSISYNFVRPA